MNEGWYRFGLSEVGHFWAAMLMIVVSLFLIKMGLPIFKITTVAGVIWLGFGIGWTK
jgi:hypothetical protein